MQIERDGLRYHQIYPFTRLPVPASMIEQVVTEPASHSSLCWRLKQPV
jgi:hypothetical protein